MPVGKLGHRETVVEALSPFPDRKPACWDQEDRVDQQQDLLAFLAVVCAASQASQRDSS